MFSLSILLATLAFHATRGEQSMPPVERELNNEYWCDLLELSDEDLWDKGIGRSIADYCFIQVGGGAAACDYYVKGRPSQTSSYDGVPRESGTDVGTGCVDVAGPFCYFYDADYDLTTEERDGMCTSSVVANAAAQLRYGIRNGYCTDNPEVGCSIQSPRPPTAPPTSPPICDTGSLGWLLPFW